MQYKYIYKNKKTGKIERTNEKLCPCDYILVREFRDTMIKSKDTNVIKK